MNFFTLNFWTTVERSGVQKLNAEKSGDEKDPFGFGVEALGWKVHSWDVLQPFNWFVFGYLTEPLAECSYYSNKFAD